MIPPMFKSVNDVNKAIYRRHQMAAAVSRLVPGGEVSATECRHPGSFMPMAGRCLLAGASTVFLLSLAIGLDAALLAAASAEAGVKSVVKDGSPVLA